MNLQDIIAEKLTQKWDYNRSPLFLGSRFVRFLALLGFYGSTIQTASELAVLNFN
jgi:hypothetical protein